MKIRKLIPLMSIFSTGVIVAPTFLTSCSNYSNINLVNGYTPSKKQKDATAFKSVEEANLYYSKLNKDYMIQDYLWSAGEYFKERMEFPSPILPFKFIDIDQVDMSIDNWWSYIDSNDPSYFISSYSWSYVISGTTEPRVDASCPSNGYIENSYCTMTLSISATKVPLTLEDTHINATNARWVIEPLTNDRLSQIDNWNVSGTAKATYTKKNSYDESITSQDMLGVYWYKDNLYDEQRDLKKSYLFPLMFDSLSFGSYHLQNCEIKTN